MALPPPGVEIYLSHFGHQWVSVVENPESIPLYKGIILYRPSPPKLAPYATMVPQAPISPYLHCVRII